MINFQTFAVIHYLETEGHMPIAVEQTHGLTLDGKIMYLKELVDEIIELSDTNMLAYHLLNDAIQQVDWIAVARKVDEYAGA